MLYVHEISKSALNGKNSKSSCSHLGQFLILIYSQKVCAFFQWTTAISGFNQTRGKIVYVYVLLFVPNAYADKPRKSYFAGVGLDKLRRQYT